MSRREILLNPGPVTLTERVRGALLRPDQCHREAEFAELVLRIRHQLEAVYDERPASHDASVVTGSGTCAVEAMVASLVPREGTALVAANGVYGERMAAMLSAQGKAHRLVRADWMEGIDVAGVRAALGVGRISAVLAVHHETTTGRLNQLDEIGRLCRDASVPLLLDAVSSFGGEAIDWQGWHLGAVAATANKCLHGVPVSGSRSSVWPVWIVAVVSRSPAFAGPTGFCTGGGARLLRARRGARRACRRWRMDGPA